MQRYLVHLILASVIWTVMLTGFNWLMDPYQIWNSPEITGVNAAKTQRDHNERIFKIVGLAGRPAKVVILGTSRSAYALDPKHKAIGVSGLNLAYSAQGYRESRMLFDWRTDNQKAGTTFALGLDFFAANVLFPYPADFVENYSTQRSWQLLASISTLKDSARTIAKNGLHLASDDDVKAKGGHRALMIASDRTFLLHRYLPEPHCVFQFVSEDGKLSPLDEVRAILSRAYREDIPMRLFISPSHARQWETLAAAGLWVKWEEWKQRLVKMNEEEALNAGKQPFPFWDFSGYNSISTETVPVLGDTTTAMRWYLDSSHYSTATGDLLLDRIFNFKDPDRSVPDDFGLLLTSANLDAHLARIRAERTEYRRTHSEDISEIEVIAREVAGKRYCRRPVTIQ